MAVKNGAMHGDPEQIRALGEAMKSMSASLANTFETELTPLIKKLRGDEVIGDSQSKEPLMDCLKEVEATIAEVQDKMNRMSKAVDAVGEKFEMNISANIRSTQEIAQNLATAKRNVTEATG